MYNDDKELSLDIALCEFLAGEVSAQDVLECMDEFDSDELEF